MTTTKFEDVLNVELSKKDENETVEAYLFIARSESHVRNAFRKRKLGSLIRKNDPYCFSSLENDYNQNGTV